MKRDKAKTFAANFLEPSSYVAPDGREVLYGTDWTARKNQLWIRAHGRCEQMVPDNGDFVRCRSIAAHPHHRIKRSRGRDDRLSNLQALCRLHHELKHPEKRPQWTKNAQ